MNNLKVWNKVKDVPREAQKKIAGGRLKGFTDISPQWRYHKMTEVFGPIGIGWKFTIDKQWLETGPDGQICAMTNIGLYVKQSEGGWSDAIPGTGGSMLAAKEGGNLRTSDEAYKMSLTDALSVAFKMLGVGAVVYSGGNDYSKYTRPQEDHQVDDRKEQERIYKSIEKQLSDARNTTELDAIMKSNRQAMDSIPPAGRNVLEYKYEVRLAEFEVAGNGK